jgi:hypothetical protein
MAERYVVQLSGGLGSWATAQRLVERHGAGQVLGLFADTLMEDADLYRFLDDIEAQLGIEVVRIADGRTPWQVFRDERMLGNARVDPCSKLLKRELLRAWIDEHCTPERDAIAIGIDWTELHRYERAVPRWLPYQLVAPLCEAPLLDRSELVELLAVAGIELPRLYRLGFPHNNCGGFCIKAGQAQFAHLLAVMPERYAEHEAAEAELRAHLGRDVAVMVDRRGGGPRRPMTMAAFRERIEAGEYVDRTSWGGCGCALDA